MTCSNNLDINGFQHDMMQCVTYNELSLFALRLKILKNKEMTNLTLWKKNNIQCSWSEKNYFIFI
jgi:hypothetical protein